MLRHGGVRPTESLYCALDAVDVESAETVVESTGPHANKSTDLRHGSLARLRSNRERHCLLEKAQVDYAPLIHNSQAEYRVGRTWISAQDSVVRT